MKISFTGNHIFKFPDREITISVYDKYVKTRQNLDEDMIIYADDYFVHVIDGLDAQNFRMAERLNKGVVNQPYLFEELTAAYRKSARVVDFSDVPNMDINA